MNIILVKAEEIIDRQVVLVDNRATHIIKVLQSEPGDRIRIGVIDGGKGTGLITEICRQRPLCVRLTVRIDDYLLPMPEIDLILALPRPIMLKRIFSQVAALGVGKLFLINANRVEKSFWEAGLLEKDQYQEHLQLGLEQAVDTRMPQVEMYRKFRPFVEDILAGIGKDYLFRVVAHPDCGSTLAQACPSGPGRILLAIGPEGGWVDFEIEMFLKQGFSCCSIGERILKVDTAVIALHARISAIREVMQRQEKGD